MKVPSLDYDRLIRALRRDGWLFIRQRGSHMRLEKRVAGKVLRITVPAHRPIKRSTLAKLLKAAELSVEQLVALL